MRRVYLDTSVILRVAYREGASLWLQKLVRNGIARSGQVQVVMVAPVLAELVRKIVGEAQHAQRYREDLSQFIPRIRKFQGDRTDRPTKIGTSALAKMAARMQALEPVLTTVANQKRSAIERISRTLAKHSVGSPLSPAVLEWSFEQEKRLRKEHPTKDAPELPDLLVIAAVRSAQAQEPGMFLTADKGQFEVAKALGMNVEHAEKWANALLAPA